mgnify:CR=1 FL=1
MSYILTRGLNIQNIEFADNNSNIINLAEHASIIITSDIVNIVTESAMDPETKP